MLFKSHWKVKRQHAALQIKFLTTVHADSDTCLYYLTCSYLSLFRCLPAAFTFFSTRTHSAVSLLTYSWVCSCGTHSTVPHTQLFPFPSLLSVCSFLSCLGMLPLFSSIRMELFLTGQLNVRGQMLDKYSASWLVVVWARSFFLHLSLSFSPPHFKGRSILSVLLSAREVRKLF